MSSIKRMRGLQGLRTISIVLIILSHVSNIGYNFNSLLWRLEPGSTGVGIFFVLSGFLITTIFLKEKQQKGSVCWKDFYLRRVRRIMPAYLVFICLVTILSQLDFARIEREDYAAALTFTANYFKPSWVLGHSWSLSVEEQFYLLWPLVLISFPHLSLKSAAPFLMLFSAVGPLAFWVQRQFGGEAWPTATWCAFEVQGGSIAWGCIAAFLFNEKYESLVRLGPKLLMATAILGAIYLSHKVAWLNITLLSIGASLVILYIATNQDSLLSRILEWSPLVWIGNVSFSLYLWQQPFFDRDNPLPLWVIVTALPTLTLLSHYCIEKPFLTMKFSWPFNKFSASLSR